MDSDHRPIGVRVLARPLTRPLGLRLLLVLLLAVVGAYSVLRIGALIPTILTQDLPPDWMQLRFGGERVLAGESPYVWDSALRFRWSPVAAWLLVPLTAFGPWIWTAAQFAALVALRSLSLAVVTLLFWPFWQDVQAGNVMVFVLLAGVWALRGNAYGIGAWFVLALLIPRPLMLPLTAWLLWKHHEWRLPFAGMAIASVGLAAVTGLLPDWIGALAASTEEVYAERWGPAVWLGLVGVIAASGAAVVLAWRGWVGAASLLISPYWLVYYPLVLILDLTRYTRPAGSSVPSPRSTSSPTSLSPSR